MKLRNDWTKVVTFKAYIWKEPSGMEKKIVWTTKIQKN